MAPARSCGAEHARARSLDLLNAHLAAAVILQDRMLQSPRHVRGVDFIMVDDLCDRIAHHMAPCAGGMAGRVADLGGTPHWPVQIVRCVPGRVYDLRDDVILDAWPVIDASPMGDFAHHNRCWTRRPRPRPMAIQRPQACWGRSGATLSGICG